MLKVYKYQKLMDEKGVVKPCPFHDCKENQLPAYHFGFDPIGDNGNFVPGHKRNSRINSEDDIRNCKYCGLSMYKTENSAKEQWSKLEPRVRRLLKYTHLLEGEIKREHGVMTIEKGQHFSFFEYAGVDLNKNFKLLSEL